MRNLVICFCTLIIAICTCACESNNDVIEHQTGVWVSDKAELLLTDKIMMYFEKQSDDAVLVMLKVDSITEDCTLFSKDTIIRQSIPEDFAMKHISSNEIIVNGQKMVKAETIEMCEPYDMIGQDGQIIGGVGLLYSNGAAEPYIGAGCLRHHLVGGASLYLPVAGFNIKIAEGVFIQRIVTRRDSLDAKETLEKPFDSKAGRKSRLSGW